MQLGVHGLNVKGTLAPADTTRLARLAERLGYTSWWAGEHVVLPNPRTADSPMAPDDPILDVLSGGRLRLGVAAGYLEPEMTAVGVPMVDRGRRTDEYLDAMTALWTQPEPSYSGTYVSFDKVDAHPRPQGLRVVVGGHSPAAFRRAVSRAHGWFGNGTATGLARHLAGLSRAAEQVERPAHLGPLEITFMQLDPVAVDAGTARRYTDLGVDHLLLYPLPMEDPGDVAAFLERHAELPR